jgi:uncharacterized protein
MMQGRVPPPMSNTHDESGSTSAPEAPAGIQWREWGRAAFDEAAAADRPVLLNLTASWCQWCTLMDSGAWADADVIALAGREFVPIRVDADRYPHVQDRYIAGGWPTNAFLTPTGEVLWAGTFLEPGQLQSVARSVVEAWRSGRSELLQEIDRRRKALESARGGVSERGLVRREAADDVYAATCDVFDPRNGGFGQAPKFPPAAAIMMLFAHAREDATAGSMADQTLDGILAGELWDAVDGGFFRYATEEDWTAPRREKLLETNAALLDAYATGAWIRGRDDWRDVAVRTVAWADRWLATPQGLWAGSQGADEAWFSAGRDARAEMTPPAADTAVNCAWNARWISALADAGARLGEPAWVGRAADALTTLLGVMASPRGGLYHVREPGGEPRFDFLLADTLEVARAAISVAQASGDYHWMEVARGLVRHMEQAYAAADGGFWDRLPSEHDIGALRYRERPFELNSLAARVLLDVAHISGERGCRALAGRALARLAPAAGRYGPDGAEFALATGEFFESPPTVVIALPASAGAADAEPLRRAAFDLRLPLLRVWTVPAGHRVGPMVFEADTSPAAYLWTHRGCSGPMPAPGALADAAAARHA